MKLTDLSLIFIVILLPIIIIVYVQTSFVVKAEKEEMYYKTVIDSAVKDATTKMKQVENKDVDIDYGYSGIKDNKLSINADVAIDTFFNSLFNNFGIAGNKSSEQSLKAYIPVVAVLDYDGIYIHSAEEDSAGNVTYSTKPKRYYTYTFGITYDTDHDTYNIVEQKNLVPDPPATPQGTSNNYIFQVTYTMDEYIYLDIYDTSKTWDDAKISSTSFYLTDPTAGKNFSSIYSTVIPSDYWQGIETTIMNNVKAKRTEVIAKTAMDTVTETVNEHNIYAKDLGINYQFVYNVDSTDSWYETVDGVGMLAVVQGISLGNKYLNYKAYSTTSLLLTKKYYLSNVIDDAETDPKTYLFDKLYHSSENCPIYKEYLFRWKDSYTDLTPKYYTNRSEAATAGYKPCPVCKP